MCKMTPEDYWGPCQKHHNKWNSCQNFSKTFVSSFKGILSQTYIYSKRITMNIFFETNSSNKEFQMFIFSYYKLHIQIFQDLSQTQNLYSLKRVPSDSSVMETKEIWRNTSQQTSKNKEWIQKHWWIKKREF